MWKNIKPIEKLFLAGLVCLTLLAAMRPARAATDPVLPGATAKTLVSGLNLPTNTSSNQLVTVPLGESDAVAFQMDVTGVHATSTNAITATFDQQVNGANWATGFTTLVVTATGTLTASGVLNLPVGAMANLRLQKIASALYGSNTTISVYSNKKPQ